MSGHCVPRVVDQLRNLYPDARASLDFTSAFTLIVATVLSAQTTDARVNTVTPELFRRWPTPAALAEASVEEVEAVVRPLGFQGRRATQVVALAAALRDRFNAEVPSDSEELESLPGVGRKTANVVRGNWFGASALTVDTHVGRLSRRLGWTRATSPNAVEKDVVALLSREVPGVDFTRLSHELIHHGRALCTARSPACDQCPISQCCPKIGVPQPVSAG